MVLFSPRSTSNTSDIAPYPLVPLRWPYLDVVEIDGKGRGVVTTRALRKGSLIERAPVLVIPAHHRALADRTVLFSYLFLWEHDRAQEHLHKGEGRAAIALGITSLVNHSEVPNARFRRLIEAQEIELRATRDIEAGEEILIDCDRTRPFTPAERRSTRAP